MRSLMNLKSSNFSRTTLKSFNCSSNRKITSTANDEKTTTFTRIENILVLGAGTMGSGIAQTCAFSGAFTSVTLHDISLIALSKARERILASLTRQAQTSSKESGAESPESILNRITLSTRYFTGGVGINSNLLIIEAIPEVLELKQTLFRNLNSQFAKNEAVIFASCSASLARDDVTKYFDARERFAGLIMNPDPSMKMVKVIRTAETSSQTMRLLQRFVADLDKVCVVSSDAKIEN